MYDAKLISEELSNLATELGLVTIEKFTQLKEGTELNNGNLYSLLLAEGLLDEVELVASISHRYGLQYLQDFNLIPPSKDFPVQYCLQNCLLPVQESHHTGEAVIAIAAPSSLNSIKNLSVMLGVKQRAVFVSYTRLIEGLRVFEDGKQTGVTGQNKRFLAPGITPSQVQNPSLKRKITSTFRPTLGEDDVVEIVNNIIDRAIRERVSDIHLEVFKSKARLRYRKNGVLDEVNDYDLALNRSFPAFASRIKIMSGLDIAERRLPQDGGAQFTASNDAEADLRVSFVPTQFGERIVLRILSKASLAVDISSLGFSDTQIGLFSAAIEAPQGLVLVTGPTGSGKSTTLYGAINHLNQPDVNILTAEDPIEYSLDGIGQVLVREEIGLTFAAALRSFLRQDPEVILVGEIRDSETADIATKAALTGHLVLSTLHTNSALGAISRLVNMGLPRFLVANALSCVVGQRLVRTNCKHCSRPYSATELSEQEKSPFFELNQSGHYRKSAGCAECGRTGFSGRKAVHEVLIINPSMRVLINEGSTEAVLLMQAQQNGFKSMADRITDFLRNGETSLEEALRTIPTEFS